MLDDLKEILIKLWIFCNGYGFFMKDFLFLFDWK